MDSIHGGMQAEPAEEGMDADAFLPYTAHYYRYDDIFFSQNFET